MKNQKTFGELLNLARKTIAYKVEGVIIEVTEQIIERMNVMKISKSDLSSRINATAPYVTKLLRGSTNFTVESMVKVADALNCDIDVRLIPKTNVADWIELMDKSGEPKREFNVWSRMKDEGQFNRGNLKFVLPPSASQQFYHESH